MNCVVKLVSLECFFVEQRIGFLLSNSNGASSWIGQWTTLTASTQSDLPSSFTHERKYPANSVYRNRIRCCSMEFKRSQLGFGYLGRLNSRRGRIRIPGSGRASPESFATLSSSLSKQVKHDFAQTRISNALVASSRKNQRSLMLQRTQQGYALLLSATEVGSSLMQLKGQGISPSTSVNSNDSMRESTFGSSNCTSSTRRVRFSSRVP